MAALSAAAAKRLARELADLHSKPPEGIRVDVDDGDLSSVACTLDGPPGTPYAGGEFRMKLSLPADFPESPPKGWFLTKIWHPNVSKTGEICVNVLKKDWSPDTGLRHVLLVIRCLLIEPFPESALNEEAGKALLEDYEEYCKYARLMTELHAAPAGGRRGGGGGGNDANSGGCGGGGGTGPGPLATGSGANAAADAGDGPGSPAVKKPKAAAVGAGAKAQPAAAAALRSKKSLRRL